MPQTVWGLENECLALKSKLQNPRKENHLINFSLNFLGMSILAVNSPVENTGLCVDLGSSAPLPWEMDGVAEAV